MIVQLTSDERDLLIDILNASIGEARQEIYRTEHHDFKNSLRARKQLMEAMLHRLIQTEDLHDSHNVEYSS